MELRIGEIADRIAEAAAPHHVFDILALMRFRFEAATAENPDFVVEESAATLELITLIISARGITARATTDDQLGNGTLDAALNEIQDAVGEAMVTGGILAMTTTARDSSTARELSFGSVLREIFVRNLAYPHMVEDTLGALFDEPAIESHCLSVLGCTVKQIRQVFRTLRSLYGEEWNRRITAITEAADVVTTGAAIGDEIPSEIIDRFRDALDSKTAYPRLNAELIASRCALPTNTVHNVLDLFITPLTERPPAEAAVDFFRGRSPLRMQPILRASDGTYAVPHDALLVHAIRERVEVALKTDNVAWTAYQVHRGNYLEQATISLLAAHLPGNKTDAGFKYLVPDNETQCAPEQYTKEVEGDGLIVVDDVAIILEAKAVALRPRSRTGLAGPLWQDLRRMVTVAAEQSDRMRHRILHDGGLRLIDGSWLNLNHIREVHTIAATLDDLSGIATVTHQLVTAGLLTEANIPWIVSLHDLRVINELIERPAELLLYLRRRTDPELTKRIRTADELDYFMYFLSGDLYVEPDPDVRRRELPNLATITGEQRRRYRQQSGTVELRESLTDEIDRWYLGQVSEYHREVDKPRLSADPTLLALIDELTARGEPGWLAITTTMLGGDEVTQRAFASMAQRIADLSLKDGLPHNAAQAGGSRRGDSFVIVTMNFVPGIAFDAAHDHLIKYLQAKKHQLQVDRGFGMLFNWPTGDLTATVYDNRIPGPDLHLDTLVNEFGLKDVRGPERRRSWKTAKPRPRRKRR
ncbi:hypothetical protein QLG13_08185 [Rhodococcus aetherivorans]|uniref:hypothetical protein n=1 Tax=Rhodococcus aetherivorans TaxID=191292 RepID=UPI0021A4D830|nr:hypothetical protein [Rhodococcus aetherivorans]